MPKRLLDSQDKTTLLTAIGDSGWNIAIETLTQAKINDILNGVDQSKFINCFAIKVIFFGFHENSVWLIAL